MWYAGASFSIKHLTCSVPRGSVFGPLLFLMYTADLADFWAKHGVTLYAFADDNQLYIHCEFHSMATSRDVLERCMQDIGHWMSANHLTLNPDKTELLWIGTRQASVNSPTAGLGWCSVLKLLMLRVLHASSEWHSRQTCVWKSTHSSPVEGVFSATSVTTCTTFTQFGGGIDNHTFICLQPGWLLQLSNGGST